MSACGDHEATRWCEIECDAAAQPSFESDVGFIEVPTKHYQLHAEPHLASRARFFFNLQPAERPSPKSPVFAITGGGPSASAWFVSAYLAPAGILPGAAVGDNLSTNPASLARLGHVLTIDGRNAGLSYPILEGASERAVRASTFDVGNYNPYRDAVDHWEVLLALSARNPALFEGPVYFLTESYGGLRAQIMLDVWLNRESYASGERTYVEPDFFERLRSWGKTHSVGGQILLEPWFAGSVQATVTGELFEEPGSVMDEIATEEGEIYERCKSDDLACDPYRHAIEQLRGWDVSLYDCRRDSHWLDEQGELLSRAVTSRANLAMLCGVSHSQLDAGLARDRGSSFRFADASHGLFVSDGDLPENYGTVASWDHYFVPLNTEARDLFVAPAAVTLGLDAGSPDWLPLFLGNLRSVKTFVSRARYDLQIFGPALIPVLAREPSVNTVQLVTATDQPSEAPSRQEVLVTYRDGESRRILSPEYASSHSVARDQALELVNDIEGFVDWTQ